MRSTKDVLRRQATRVRAYVYQPTTWFGTKMVEDEEKKQQWRRLARKKKGVVLADPRSFWAVGFGRIGYSRIMR